MLRQRQRSIRAAPSTPIDAIDPAELGFGMGQPTDHTALARAIIDSNVYMVLGTADVSPPAANRLYRAVATEHWIRDPGEGSPDRRVAVTLT